MEIGISVVLGYLIGTFNPAALFAKIKKANLRDGGTGNLGATNALLIMGKAYGLLVMVLDILKGFLAFRLAAYLFPAVKIAGMMAGLAAIIGHIFPFYLNFKGGKGLAAFGGMILGYKPAMFWFVLITGFILIFIFNYSVALPMFAALAFPIMVWFHSESLELVAIAIIASAIIVVKHWSNIGKAKNGTDNKVRQYFKKHFLHKEEQSEQIS